MASNEQNSKCDVLIVGAGPAGIMMAMWMARFNINTRIVDTKSSIGYGQADGLTSRTLEIFDSFNIADLVQREGIVGHEVAFWANNEQGDIHRTSRSSWSPSTIDHSPPVSSRHQMNLLVSGKLSRIMLDQIESLSDIRVEWDTAFESVAIDESMVEEENAYPVTVGITHQGASSTVHAKYMVACDGGRSLVRRNLGIDMVGQAKESVFGVIDIIPITNFPDTRRATIIHGATGSVLQIPREGNLVRYYVELDDVQFDGNGRVVKSDITPESILKCAQEIYKPYNLTYKTKNLAWWTVYQIGQRLATNMTVKDRVFLAGDAVHTDSPKAGLGMNTSMQDTYNLGWKLGLVVRGLAPRQPLLATYEEERGKVAKELIDFDIQYSRIFSREPLDEVLKSMGFSHGQLMQYVMTRLLTFGQNIGITYPSNVLTKTAERKDKLAEKIWVGVRMESTPILNHSDTSPIELGRRLQNDGRFRVLLFAGNVKSSEQFERIKNFERALLEPTSFLIKHTPKSAHVDSLFDIITIHSAPIQDLELFDFPDTFHPLDEDLGWAYDKVYGEGKRADGPLTYDYFGIDRVKGCVVIVRLDHHVGWIGECEDVDAMNEYFGSILHDGNRGSTP